MARRKTASSGHADFKNEEGVSPLHPAKTPDLIGHSAVERAFLSAYNGGTLHHAWLLVGAKGIGKATFAFRAARFLLQGPPSQASSLAVPLDHPAARQIAAQAHPSLFAVGTGAEPSTIGVDEVRKLKSFLGLTSPGGWRAVIVDSANGLTISSSNALLKAIEEPPPRTVFFLITHGAAAVMPTIRSRCIAARFSTLAQDDFVKAVTAACTRAALHPPGDANLWPSLYSAASRSPGAALDLLAGDAFPLMQRIDAIFLGLPQLDYGAVHALIASASGARNAAVFARVCLAIEARIEATARDAVRDGQASVASGWALFHRIVQQRRLDVETLNLDRGAFLLALFSDMERVARGEPPIP